MNIDTGELRSLQEFDKHMGNLIAGGLQVHEDWWIDKEAQNEQKQLEDVAKKINQFTPIPDELEHAAKIKLNGQESAMVSLTSGGKLSKWAAQKRKERRKVAKESRRKNRK